MAGGGREDIVDIRELRVEGLEITPSSLQAVDHTPRGTHWTFVGPDFRHNWTKFASSVETAKFTNAYNSANLMGGADSLDLDLGRQVVTVAIGINQAPSLQNGDLYNMIRQARLEFSQDADFNTLVATRNVDLDNFRTFQLLDYEPVNARYVRLTANSLYLGDINEFGYLRRTVCSRSVVAGSGGTSPYSFCRAGIDIRSRPPGGSLFTDGHGHASRWSEGTLSHDLAFPLRRPQRAGREDGTRASAPDGTRE